MSRMKPSRRKKFEEYREYIGNAFVRERTFLKTLDLVYGVTTYMQRWLSDLDSGNPLPVICYTSVVPPEESKKLFGDLKTEDRIALNAETIGLFEDRDNAMVLLSQELSYRKEFFSRFIRDCEEESPIEDTCFVDEEGSLLASVGVNPDNETSQSLRDKGTQTVIGLVEEEGNSLPPQDANISSVEPVGEELPTFEKLDFIFYLSSPYLNCEDRLILDVAMEGSHLRSSPFMSAIRLCNNSDIEAIADVSIDIYSDIQANRHPRIVKTPYIGWVFFKNFRPNTHYPKMPGPAVIGQSCICGTSLRHLYQRKAYSRLRGIARNLDDLPKERGRTVLGYNFVHTLTL